MYEKYLKCIFLLIICIGCKANINSGHASVFRPPQLPPHVRQAFERSAEALTSNSNQDRTQHHHQYYYTEQQKQQRPPTSDHLFIESRKDAIHKPRAGEILVKDSVLYNNNETPASSQQQQLQLQMMGATIRRNYWPQIDNAVTSLTSKAAAAGNAVKNLLKVGFFSTFDNVNAAVEHKKHKIASYLIQAAQEHKLALQQAKEQEQYRQQMKLAAATLGNGVGLGATGIGAGTVGAGIGAAVAAAINGVTQHIPLTNQAPSLLPLAKPLTGLIPLKQQLAKNVVQHFSKHFRKPIKSMPPPWIVYSKTKTLPTTTVSEGYVHTFDNKYMPPNFGAPYEKNPYADMGVTSYKHFEDTILRELEEKEERKVEATMHTLFDDQYVVKETLEGTKPGFSQEWTPTFSSHENGLFVSSQAKPFTSFTQSSFDRPFLDVRPVCEHTDEIPPAQPTLFVFPAHADGNELAEASNEHSITITAADAKLNGTAVNTTTTEKPNYPAYFIKQQQELRKLQQKLVRSKSVYGNKVSSLASGVAAAAATTTTTTVSPKTAHQKRQRGKSPYSRRSTSTTTTTSTTVSPTTLSIPTTTTATAPLFFFNMNGTDDGFQPMLPNEVKAMKIKKPTNIHMKLQYNGTLNGLNGAIRQRSSTTTSPSIQAQASHVHISVVSAPNASKTSSRAKWAGKSSSIGDMKGSYTRHAPKKALKSPTVSNKNTTAANANQKQSRGSIKFNDSLHQSQNS